MDQEIFIIILKFMLTDNDIPLYFSGTREYGSSCDDYY